MKNYSTAANSTKKELSNILTYLPQRFMPSMFRAARSTRVPINNLSSQIAFKNTFAQKTLVQYVESMQSSKITHILKFPILFVGLGTFVWNYLSQKVQTIKKDLKIYLPLVPFIFLGRKAYNFRFKSYDTIRLRRIKLISLTWALAIVPFYAFLTVKSNQYFFKKFKVENKKQV